MCGIAGIFAKNGEPFSLEDHLAHMSQTLKHRGPDAGSSWTDRELGVGLAHRRLAIVELSELGAQPMMSHNGRFVAVYNGEIYNHLELRLQLEEEGHRPEWRGASDTETLLECWAIWGGPATLQRLVGMFAAAIWDSREKKLTLFRDRFGEKPLYFGINDRMLVFASQLKAFDGVPGFELTISEESVGSFMRLGYVPAPHSIYREVKKLTPGTSLEIGVGFDAGPHDVTPRPFWSAVDTAREMTGKKEQLTDDEEVISRLDHVLGRAVGSQMMADVPLGAFLSGGIDSSLVVALMQKFASSAVNTFSIGSSDSDYNEAIYASEVAQHLGTKHTELYVSGEDCLALIPKLPEIYDEPFADSSQIPTFLVSQLARQRVKVSLTGDGGDELFGGYSRYFQVAARWKSLSRMPRFARMGLALVAEQLSPDAWNKIVEPVIRLGSSRPTPTRIGEKIHKAAGILPFKDSRDLYSRLVSILDPASVTVRGTEHIGVYEDVWPLEAELTHQMMLVDTLTYLQDDILVKVDRAAMANSLETRAPFLDHRVFEFAWSLPLSMKVRNGDGKWALQSLLAQYVPPEMTNRPKMGFGVPIGNWLRTSLREWAEDVLFSECSQIDGIIGTNRVRSLWTEHVGGGRNHQYPLWNVIMFKTWFLAHGSTDRGCNWS